MYFPSLDIGGRTRRLPVLSLIALLCTITGCGGRPPTASEPAGAANFAFWLAIGANVIKIAEVVVVLWGARQLWLGRDERRRAEQEAAEIARKAANYQAWQVVNTAQGKGGSGGRIDALQDLTRNEVSLAGVRLDGAWLEGLDIPGADLRRASLTGANLRGAVLRGANLELADLSGADLTGADLSHASLKAAKLSQAVLTTADVSGADLTGLRGWDSVASVSYLNIEGVRHAPRGFGPSMLERGAVEGDQRPAEPSEVQQSFSQEWRSG
jgi:Pentapeptide repeats (8 copies)